MQELCKLARCHIKIDLFLKVHSPYFYMVNVEEFPLHNDFTGKLLDHQVQAVEWCSKRQSGILGLEMGLGKTVISCYLMCLFFSRYCKKRCLILAPKSTFSHWEKNILQFTTFEASDIFIYSGWRRHKYIKQKIIISNYECIRADFTKKNGNLDKWLPKISMIIIDEAHMIRNFKSQTFSAIYELINKYQIPFRWFLTGTVICNQLDDFNSIILLARINLPKTFKGEKYTLIEENGGGGGEDEGGGGEDEGRSEENIESEENEENEESEEENEESEESSEESEESEEESSEESEESEDENEGKSGKIVSIDACFVKKKKNYKIISTQIRKNMKHNKLNYFLHIKKDQCPGLNLPEKNIKEHYLHFSKNHRNYYETIFDQIDILTEENSSRNMLALLLRLRQSSTHPDCAIPRKYFNSQELSFMGSTPKIDKILEIVENIGKDEKIVIFSQWTQSLKVISYFLNLNRLDHYFYSERNLFKFKHSKKHRILLISLKAGGLGLNLIMANHLILTDPYWNSSVEEQAIDRIHRIGQTKKVFIHKLYMKKSIEQFLLDIQKEKGWKAKQFFKW